MTNKLTYFLFALILVGYSCTPEKEERLISLLDPDSDVSLMPDTAIIVTANTMSALDSIQVLLGDSVISSSNTSLLSHVFEINSRLPVGSYDLKAIGYHAGSSFSSESREIDIVSYRAKWLGRYSGMAIDWIRYPGNNPGEFYYNEDTLTVAVNVSESKKPNEINLYIDYNNLFTEEYTLEIHPDGQATWEHGVGTGYESIDCTFRNDSIIFSQYQRCGQPCNSGIRFEIQRDN